MSVEIRQPSITAQGRDQQLQQMRSYLYQLARQLNWAFSTLEAGAVTVSPQTLSQPEKGKTDPGETFAAVKSLIIKSADIIDAYTEAISKTLRGEYVAQSDFGTFREQTAQTVAANSTGLTQLFTDLQELRGQTVGADAYLRSGILEYRQDGTPVYGLEIGQKTVRAGEPVFDKFARFTAEKLSFYDSSDVEVAYISDYRMFITSARITGELQLAEQFSIRCDGLSMDFQWIGG